ncbi:hypothetical protein FKM82_001774 [Ascaphus truei]
MCIRLTSSCDLERGWRHSGRPPVSPDPRWKSPPASHTKSEEPSGEAEREVGEAVELSSGCPADSGLTVGFGGTPLLPPSGA